MYKIGDKIRARVLLMNRFYPSDNIPQLSTLVVESVDVAGNILAISHEGCTPYFLAHTYIMQDIELITEPRESPLKLLTLQDLQVYLCFAQEIRDLDTAQKISNEIAIRYNKLKSEL